MDNSVSDIYNFLKLSDSIATAGQPTADQFSAIKNSGYQIVINLALSTSTNAISQEQEIVESQQMRYVHIPVNWEEPTIADVQQFFTVLQAQDKPVFVHCAMNMRVSAFMYLYRRIHQGLGEAAAAKDLHQIWIPNENWQRFIAQVLAHYGVE